jgi:hypothetical protein
VALTCTGSGRVVIGRCGGGPKSRRHGRQSRATASLADVPPTCLLLHTPHLAEERAVAAQLAAAGLAAAAGGLHRQEAHARARVALGEAAVSTGRYELVARVAARSGGRSAGKIAQ